jgi:hypothetical protein
MHNVFIKILGSLMIVISLHRIFYLTDDDRLEETNNLGLTSNFSSLIILAQFIMGMLLISDIESNKLFLQISLIFVIFSCLLMLYNNYNKISETYKEIWTFQPTAMSFSLHLFYVLIILMLLYGNTDKPSA